MIDTDANDRAFLRRQSLLAVPLLTSCAVDRAALVN